METAENRSKITTHYFLHLHKAQLVFSVYFFLWRHSVAGCSIGKKAFNEEVNEND